MITMGNSSKVCGFVSMSSSNKSVCIKWLQQCLAHIGIICSPCCYCCFILTKCPHCHLKKFTFSQSYSMFYISMYAYACTYTYIHVHTHTHRLCFSHTRLTECLGKFHHSFMPILSFAIPSTWNSILLTYMTINFLLIFKFCSSNYSPNLFTLLPFSSLLPALDCRRLLCSW